VLALPAQWRQFLKERLSGKWYNIHEPVSSPVLEYFSWADGNESDEGDTTASRCGIELIQFTSYVNAEKGVLLSRKLKF
jgi:hypothetical protein